MFLTYRDIGYDGDGKSLQYTSISHTRTLQDLWASKSSSCDDDKFVRLDSLVDRLRKSDFGLVFTIWFVFDTDGTRWRGFVEQDSNNF